MANPPQPRSLHDVKRYLDLLRHIARERMGKIDYPALVTYQVTLLCNARCIMCDSWKTRREDTMTLEDIDRIFSQLRPLLTIRISGGEPFVLKDLYERIEIIHRHTRPHYLHITSNGFLTDRLVSFVENFDLPMNLDIKISVDGYQEVHDRIRGQNAWSKAFESVRQLGKLSQTRKWFYLGVNQVLTLDDPMAQYLDLKKALDEIDVPLHTVFAVEESPIYTPGARKDIAPSHPGEFRLFKTYPKDTLEELLDLFDEEARRIRSLPERWVLQHYLQGLRNRLLREKGSPNPRCVALHRHLRILPNGDVPHCYYNTIRVGNLRESSFEDLWFGEALRKGREWVRKCPGCWIGCEVSPNSLLTGSIATVKAKRALGLR